MFHIIFQLFEERLWFLCAFSSITFPRMQQKHLDKRLVGLHPKVGDSLPRMCLPAGKLWYGYES